MSTYVVHFTSFHGFIERAAPGDRLSAGEQVASAAVRQSLKLLTRGLIAEVASWSRGPFRYKLQRNHQPIKFRDSRRRRIANKHEMSQN